MDTLPARPAPAGSGSISTLSPLRYSQASTSTAGSASPASSSKSAPVSFALPPKPVLIGFAAPPSSSVSSSPARSVSTAMVELGSQREVEGAAEEEEEEERISEDAVPRVETPGLAVLGATMRDNEKRKASEELARPAHDAHLDRPHPSAAASIATLPLPLPSKRFKKSPTAKAVLIPVEQLPVYPLPPPPPITDPILLETVFTHQSLFERTRGRFEDGNEGAKHYEKLEHVGDSLLGMVVTTWLHEDKPRLTCGTASKLKAHLVSNATLSHLSGLYNFPHRLRGAPEHLPVLRAQTDVRAALMEAYIAGVYFSFPPDKRLSEGLAVLDRWLREMYEPLCDFFFRYMRSEYEQHHLSITSALDGSAVVLTEDEMAAVDAASQGMSNLLQMYCHRQAKEMRYDEERFETHCGILWKMRCFVDGVPVGEATRSARRAAKNVAAWEACKRFGLVDDVPAVGLGAAAAATAD